MNIRKIIILLCLFTCYSSQAQNWEKLDAPSGGDINRICGFDSVLAVVTNIGAIYVSQNMGNTWRTPQGFDFNVTSIDAINKNIYTGISLYNGDSSYVSLYVSKDSGITWLLINNPLGTKKGISWITKIISFNNNLYAATDAGIFLSKDEGITWVEKNNGLESSYLYLRDIDANDSTLFTIDPGWEGAVYLSSDSGNNWTKSLQGDYQFTSISVQDTIVIVSINSTPSVGTYYSLDNGKTWNFTFNGYHSSNIIFKNRIYIGGWFGDIIATDKLGTSWFTLNNGFVGSSINVLEVVNNTLYAGTGGAGIYRWQEQDSTWMQNKNLYAAEVSGIVLSKEKNIYVSTNGNGILKSENKGVTWKAINDGLTRADTNSILQFAHRNITGLALVDTTLWISATEGLLARKGAIYRTTSKIDYWQLMPGTEYRFNTGVQATNSIIMASTLIDAQGKGLLMSKNDGNNWFWVSDSTNDIPQQSYPYFTKKDTLYAHGAFKDSTGWGLMAEGIFMSTDLGVNWINISGNLPDFSDRQIYQIHKKNNWVFLSCNFWNETAPTGVYASNDMGNTWQFANIGLPYNTFNFVDYNSVLLFAGTSSGVFYTTNYGNQWYELNSTLRYKITAMVIDTPYLYAGTNSYGLWRLNFINKLSTTSFINPVACNSYTSPSTKHVWTQNGTYTDILINSTGFDSIITVNLIINNVDNSVTIDSNTLTATADSATYQWLICDSIFIPISGENEKTFTATANGNYAVTITQNGCTDTSSCYNVAGIGVDEINYSNSIKVYPNPFSESTTFYFNDIKTSFTLKIYNLLGFVVETKNISPETSFTFNRKEIPSGVYFYKIENVGAFISSGKLVVF